MSAPQSKKGNVQKSDGKLSGRFSEVFYHRVPAADLVGWNASKKDAAARSMLEWAMTRTQEQHKVRVLTPEKETHSVVQVVNDDMPFLVDSITAELAAQSLAVEALFHPILGVKRNAPGHLQDISAEAKAAGYTAESYIYILLEQPLSEDAAKSLERNLEAVLADARLATTDWSKMIERMDAVISELAVAPPPRKDDWREAQEFLSYLSHHNFTFLGYRAFRFADKGGKLESKKAPGSSLGVLKNNIDLFMGDGVNSPELRALKETPLPVMITKLIDSYATVHRRAPLDAISVKKFGKDGKLAGMHLFVGLFTSSTYSCRTSDVPIVRAKVQDVIRRAGFPKGTHDRTALEHILEKMPRDEIFQTPASALYEMALGILRLQMRQRIALFMHIDPMRRHISCLVYVPRERYDAQFRIQAAKLLEEGLQGEVANYFTTLDDSPLARILFTVKLKRGVPDFDAANLEARLIDAGREWDEKLRRVLVEAMGKREGAELARVYASAFPAAYHESIAIDNAVHDVRRLEALAASDENISVDFYRLQNAPADEMRLKVYHKAKPVTLADILPVLENMGLRCISEMPYEVQPLGAAARVWIHDFVVHGSGHVVLDAVKANFEEAFLSIWRGICENDRLNQLVLLANLTWPETRILRTYNNFMHQQKFPFTRAYAEQVLSLYPDIAKELVALFKERHDPHLKIALEKRGLASAERLDKMLQLVSKLDHDRILRGFKVLIERTLRTSYHQTNKDGQPKPYLAVKLDSQNIPDLPQPRPMVEIFLFSPRVEAVHLRGGKISRGGIRWSDRHDDFRTEILGLIKAQMVKNAVIVPTGAKGGFVVKQPPVGGDRAAYLQEGIECYKIFVQALLDLTDNNVKGKVVRPKHVVCYDEEDPYLVVAADKGTATFSNIANALSADAGFWLQDAFASGGSTGYDHKEIGITARGGWECVKRHFREMGKNIQAEPFTVVGVGDMGGDVFGNAVLLSPQIRLVGVFNHMHIFCDPEPDIAKSFAERERLFKTRGGWDAYDTSKLSPGGMIYERSAKSLKLTPQIKKRFNLDADNVTPDDLIRAILRAEVELLWFGGIGTYIKSARQSHADVDDKANDALRVDGWEVRAQVVGEGANLGVTQLGRIEYARRGGRINTDFIDNSGGVDCSDHEVNIKILLADVMTKGKMTLPQRDKLMAQMTDDVAVLVLKDNYQQSQSLSVWEQKAANQLGIHADFINDLEKSGHLKRQLEGLPDKEAILRMTREGLGLTRPELCTLLAYAKMTLFNDIMKTDVPDDLDLTEALTGYFPRALQKYGAEIESHKLKREIVATQLANEVINRMGPVFVRSRSLKTGASAGEVVKAYTVIADAFGARDVWRGIEALDNKIPAAAQLRAIYDVSQTVKRGVTWLLRFGGGNLDVSDQMYVLKSGISDLKQGLSRILPDSVRDTLAATVQKSVEAGLPEKLASEIAALVVLSSANDIISIAKRSKRDARAVAVAYFHVGERLGLGWLRHEAAAMVPENDWQARALSGLLDDFYMQQAILTAAILQMEGKSKKADSDHMRFIRNWFDTHQEMIGKISEIIEAIKAEPGTRMEMLTLAGQRISQLVQQVAQSSEA